MKVLLAEDDLTSRMVLKTILEKWGYEPVAVNDGRQAWEIMQGSEAPRLVILDWGMPVLSGLDLCLRIRQSPGGESPYIILLTAKSDKQDIVKGLEAGANDYIAKPYDNEELRARINVGRRFVEMQRELEKARDRLAHEATHDPLTGVLNRRALIAGLEKEIARSSRGGQVVSVGLFDIDFFKQVNDIYGHQTGDEVLCGFAGIIRKNVREFDLFGRYGGEEFLVVAPHTSGYTYDPLYERLRRLIAETQVQTAKGGISITASVGTAACSGRRSTDQLLAAADKALYQAKSTGRNRVCREGEKQAPGDTVTSLTTGA